MVTGFGTAIGAAEPDDNQVTVAQTGNLADRRNEFHRLVASLSIRHISRAVSITGIVLAVIGLAGTALSSTAESAGSSLYLGLRC